MRAIPYYYCQTCREEVDPTLDRPHIKIKPPEMPAVEMYMPADNAHFITDNGRYTNQTENPQSLPRGERNKTFNTNKEIFLWNIRISKS